MRVPGREEAGDSVAPAHELFTSNLFTWRMHTSKARSALVRIAGFSSIAAGLAAAITHTAHPKYILTSLQDFHQPGTQPNTLQEPILSSDNCSGCHGHYDPDEEPYTRWTTSMMAQSTRDPVFHAALAIAGQDAKDSGELCLRCHAPGAWLAGRSVPTDGSALNQTLGDFDGVTCNLCHRLVDPIAERENPPSDTNILAMLAEHPVNAGGGQFIIDPNDVRRGPFQLADDFFYHEWAKSPFHEESLLCATCHEVSNPIYSRQPDGSYALNAFDTPHPTQDKYDEFPIERTYSEWSRSAFAQAPIDMGGRFGGNTTAVGTCQDCHVPTTSGTACNPGLNGAYRDDLPLHDFNGSNSWVLDAVRSLYSDLRTGLNDASVAAHDERNRQMLHNAADLYGTIEGGDLVVRVVNQTGHKLPSGYTEGRRAWLNVQFYDASNNLIAERGAYDLSTATLTENDTKVYEAKLGLDAVMASFIGLPAAPSFHFVLNNKVYKDNRIPPRGFTNAGFASVQAAPVGATFAEENYWDDTHFALVPGAAYATVRLYHQTSSREYMEFLRDEDTTNDAGHVAYDQWVAHGKSAPILMQSVRIVFASPPCLPTIAYGSAKTLSNGRVPSLSTIGTASATTHDLKLVVKNGLPGEIGMVLSSAQSGSRPFQGGTLLLADPIQRAGRFPFDAQGSALIPVAVDASMIGTARNYQVILRDAGSPEPYGLTNAVHADFCP